MGRIARIFRTAFQSTVSDPQIRDHEVVKENIARGVVRRTSTGNVRLQRGQYLTEEQSRKHRERVKDYSFDERETVAVTRKFTNIRELYDTAERHIKEVELCRSEVPFGAITELRYAGHHLLKGLAADEAGDFNEAEREFQDAQDHCKRAMYEASEAGIGYCLDLLKAFKNDYKDIQVLKIVPAYITTLELANETVAALTRGRLGRSSPTNQTNEYMGKFRKFKMAMDGLEASREELNKEKITQARSNRRFILTTVLIVAGLVIGLARFLSD